MRVRPLALTFALAFGASALADEHSSSLPPPSISVIGGAWAEVLPDMAILTLSISVEKPTAADAAAENARIAKAVIDGLKSAGVAAQDIQTVGLSIYPEFTNSGSQNSVSQKRSVTAYHANDNLNVRVRAIEKAGALAGAAVEAGALYQGIRFDISDRAARQDALRAAAVENAHHRAELYAKGASMKLGLPRTIVAQGAGSPDGVFPRANAVAMSRAAPNVEPPIEAGTLTLRESVDATFDMSAP
jgi:uncharacterized protein